MIVKKQTKTQQQKNVSKVQKLKITKQHNDIREEKPVRSEMFQSLYLPKMQKIKIEAPQQVYQRLANNLIFKYTEAQHDNKFSKICVKTNWQSTVYKVKIDNVETQMKILNLNARFNQFSPPPFTKGQFGQVSSLQYKQKQYALKSIKICPDQDQQFQKALQEVCMMKIASSLKIGPHMQNIFGYDAILFSDALQFVMELCQTSYNKKQIYDEIQNKQLYKSLKLLHSLQICHGDIKYENIGWSQTYGKFVFLDFGFSKFVQVPVGFKTYSKFAGTYRYCSQQLKKIYLLRKKSYVDLYYNDLHCLEKSMQQFQNQLTNTQTNFYDFQDRQNNFHMDFQEYNKVTDEHGVQFQIQRQNGMYSDLCSFYLLKFHLFNKNLEQISQIVNLQKNLICSFRKILYEEAKYMTNYKDYQYIAQIYDNYNKFYQDYSTKTNKIKQLDALVYDYILKMSCRDTQIFNHKQKLQRVMQMDKCFEFIEQAWGEEKRMLQIFYFLSDDIYKQRIINSSKRNFLSQLYAYIVKYVPVGRKSKLKSLKIKSRTIHACSMLHQVMLAFFEYFYEKKNKSVLEQILPYFIIFVDHYNLQIMENSVLQLYKPNLKLYLIKNLQFFIGKIIAGIEPIYYQINTIQKLQQILMSLNQPNQQKQAQKEVKQLYQQTLKIIKLLRAYNSFYCHELARQKISEQISLFLQNPIGQILDSHIRYTLKRYSQFQLQRNLLSKNLIKNKGYNDPNLKSRYLQAFHVYNLQITQVQLLQNNDENNMTEKIFLQLYFPFTDLHQNAMLNYINEELIQHFLAIRLNHNFQITQQQVLLIFELVRNPKEVQEFIMSYFQNVNLHKIKNLAHMIKVYTSLYRCLCVLVPEGNNFFWQIFADLRINLANMTLQFLQITKSFIQQAPDIEPNLNPTITTKNQLVFHYKITKGLALICLLKLDEAAKVLIQIQFKAHFMGSLFHQFCTIYQNKIFIKPQTQKLVKQRIYEGYNHGDEKYKNIQNKFIFLNMDPLICKIIVQIYIETQGLEAGFKLLFGILSKGTIQNSSYVRVKARPTIQCFLDYCLPMDCIRYLTQLVSHKSVSLYPYLSILIFQMVLKSQGYQIHLNDFYMKKALILCAKGFQKINILYLNSAKRYLLVLIQKYFEKQTKKRTSIYKKLRYKSQTAFRNELNKTLRMLKIKRNPPAIIERIEQYFLKVLNCQNSKIIIDQIQFEVEIIRH